MDLQSIQTAVTNLSDSDYKLFTTWLTEHDFARWDKQIEEDLRTGRLDQLIDEATQEFHQGRTVPL